MAVFVIEHHSLWLSILDMINSCFIEVDHINPKLQITIQMVDGIRKLLLYKELYRIIASIINNEKANNFVILAFRTFFPLYWGVIMNALLHRNKIIVIPQKQIQDSNHSFALGKQRSNH